MAQYVATAVVLVVLVVVVILAILRRKARSAPSSAKRKGSSSVQADQNRQLYIGNLSYRLSEDGLNDFFVQFGDIESVRVIKDRRTGRSKGFAFITFETAGGANAALSAHDQDLSGRSLIVRHAKPAAN